MTAVALRKNSLSEDEDRLPYNTVVPYSATGTGQGLSDPAFLVIQKFLDAQEAMWKSIFELSLVKAQPAADQTLKNLRVAIIGNSSLTDDPMIMRAAQGAARRMEDDGSIDPGKWALEISEEFSKYKD